MQFLGTGAAEMVPNPFCDCEVCQRARRTGEAPRLRSALMLDEHGIVDFGPDVLAASSLYKIPLTRLDNVFITHTHEDHFSIGNISVLEMTDKRTGHYPIHFHLSQEGYLWLMKYIEADGQPYGPILKKLTSMGRVEFHPVMPYAEFEAGGMKIFTVESNHHVRQNEYALNYLFDRGDRGTLFYVADSGVYSDKNIEILSGAKADFLVMEGTFGSLPRERSSGHLNAEFFVEQVEIFARSGIIKTDARIFVTHINQCNTFSHEEYQSYLNEKSGFDITVAYDGMIV